MAKSLNSPQKVLFCGLGSIGQRHVRNLRALLDDEVEILAYRNRGCSPVLNPNMTVREGADLETTYKIRSFTDLSDALTEKPEVVFVTNPNSLHLSVALEAARTGCHLFIEKPLSHSLDGVDELIEIVAHKGLVALVAYQFRFHPALTMVKSMIDEGRLGRLAAVHIVNGEYLPDWHPYENYRETHAARRDLGGGCLSLQTHEFDYALWMFGMPKRVFAVGGHLSELEVDVEDSVSVLLHCENNGLPLPVHIHLDFLQRPPQRVCEIVGDAGRVRFDYYANQVEFHEAGSRKVEIQRFDDFDRNQMFIAELNHFLACLRGEATPLVDLHEGRRSMVIGLAGQKSMQTQQVVPIADG